MKKKYIVSFFTIMILFGLGSVFTWVINRPINPIKKFDLNTIKLDAKKQIMFDQFGETNFTCTGMTYDSKSNTIWIADYGLDKENEKMSPRLIEVDNDFNEVLVEIDLDEYVDDLFNLQGISYDKLHNSLWLATGEYVFEISKDGKQLSKFYMGDYAKYKSNGIAVDGDDIWVLCYEKYLLKLNRKGEVLNKYTFNFKDQDQIFIRNNKIYCTIGADYLGDNNFIFTFDINTQEINNEFQIKSSNSIEGIIIINDIMYIANDGLFHSDIVGRSYITEYKIK